MGIRPMGSLRTLFLIKANEGPWRWRPKNATGAVDGGTAKPKQPDADLCARPEEESEAWKGEQAKVRTGRSLPTSCSRQRGRAEAETTETGRQQRWGDRRRKKHKSTGERRPRQRCTRDGYLSAGSLERRLSASSRQTACPRLAAFMSARSSPGWTASIDFARQDETSSEESRRNADDLSPPRHRRRIWPRPHQTTVPKASAKQA